MKYLDNGDSMLVAQFREFFAELVAIKELVAAYPSRRAMMADAGAPPAPDALDDDTVEAIVDAVRTRLTGMIERQQHTAQILGPEYRDAYDDACYTMVALADEVLLQIDWVGREQWRMNLLESQLFRSHIAGEQVFQRAERLMMRHDLTRTELAKVYLMVLSLGFQGKFRRRNAEEHLRGYRQRLHAFIVQHDPEKYSSSRSVFASPTLDTRNDELRRLPPAKRWVAVLGGVLAMIILVSSWMWSRSITPEIRSLLEQILG